MDGNATAILTWAQVGSTVATAAATIALVVATIVLARHTRRMADSSSQPHIVATLEVNQWSVMHFDIRVTNAGTGVAYDIEVEFDPPLKQDERHRHGLPLRKISILRPGQSMAALIGEYPALKDTAYTVTTSWRRFPGAEREKNRYAHSVADWDSVISLNGGSPHVHIAKSLQHLRDDWKSVASGARRVNVDIFSQAERDRARAKLEEWFEQHEDGKAKE